MDIPYIFAGETEIDVDIALEKLKTLVGVETLVLEGGSIVNGYFIRADAVDEISLVVAPVVAGEEGKPLFMNAKVSGFELSEVKQCSGTVWLNYKKV